MTCFKRASRMVTVLFALLLLCMEDASAAYLGVGTVKGDGLRLRAEASVDSAILDTAAVGTSVVVLEDAGNGWYKVNLRSVEGYMSADYLDVEAQADADMGSGRVETSGSSLNVRSGPGTDYAKVASLGNGTVVKITGVDSGWYKIDSNGTVGYVSSDYLVPCEETSAAPAVSPEGASMAQQVLDYAKQFLGTPYVYGGNGPNSFDCSGFTKYVYTHFGYNINRTASTQLNNGTPVSKDALQPGDLVFFRNDNDSHAASHVGIYVGDSQFIHASSDSRVVEFSSLNTRSNTRKYVGARRII